MSHFLRYLSRIPGRLWRRFDSWMSPEYVDDKTCADTQDEPGGAT